MFELMQKLVAFKYSCKLNHWTTTSYSQHLLFDRLQEDIDELVDGIGEMYFMGLNKKAELSNSLLNPAYINSDLSKSVLDIIDTVKSLSEKEELTHGMQALLDDICKAFCAKKALLTMK